MSMKRIELRAYGPANLFPLAEEIPAELTAAQQGEGFLHLFSVGSTGVLVMLPEAAQKAYVAAVMEKISWQQWHRHPGNAFAHLRSSILGCDLWLRKDCLKGSSPRPYLLENTAGRKRRPILITSIGGHMKKPIRLDFESHGWIDIVNVSFELEKIIRRESSGLLMIEAITPQTALIAIEYEPALLLDTADFFSRLVEDVAESHKADVAAALMRTTMAVPFESGRMQNGVWQQIALIDFGQPGPKSIACSILSASGAD